MSKDSKKKTGTDYNPSEKLTNDGILEVIVTLFLIVVMVLIFLKFEFF